MLEKGTCFTLVPRPFPWQGGIVYPNHLESFRPKGPSSYPPGGLRRVHHQVDPWGAGHEAQHGIQCLASNDSRFEWIQVIEGLSASNMREIGEKPDEHVRRLHSFQLTKFGPDSFSLLELVHLSGCRTNLQCMVCGHAKCAGAQWDESVDHIWVSTRNVAAWCWCFCLNYQSISIWSKDAAQCQSEWSEDIWSKYAWNCGRRHRIRGQAMHSSSWSLRHSQLYRRTVWMWPLPMKLTKHPYTHTSS